MQIILTSQSQKESLLKKKETFANIKIYTIEELKSVYPYLWSNETIDYIMSAYDVILPVAKIYLDQIILYDIDNIPGVTGNMLKEIKKNLIAKSLLKENILLKKELESSPIEITIPKETWLTTWLKDYKLIFKEEEDNNYSPTIYEFSSFNNELLFVTEKIKELLENNVSPKNIFITNLETSDYLNIKRIMDMASIPITINDNPSLAKTTLGNIFLKKLETLSLNEAIDYLKSHLDSNDLDLFNDIINVVNNYVNLDHAKDFVKHSLNNTLVKRPINTFSITEKSILDIEPNEDNYIFLLNATSNILPLTTKDEDFLSDEIKSLIGGTTSLEKNKIIKESTLKKILSIKNITITYSTTKDGKELYPSSLIKDYEVIKNPSLKYNVSNKLNKIILTKELDEYTKYNVISSTLKDLNCYYSLPYQTYDNSYKKIKKDTLNEYLKTINISYSSMDTYNKCPFKYFITNVLRITPYEETWQIFVGNLFHKILENKDLKDWSRLYDELSTDRDLTYKEKFFLKKLKTDLAFILKTLKDNETENDLPYEAYETELIVPITPNVTVTGRIDKMKYAKVNDKSIVTLIDYKTGNAKIDPSIMPLGFSLQLPTYLYLLKNTANYKDAIFGGIYFQNILPTRITYEENKTLDYQKKENLKLHGFSNNDQSILKYVDKHYENSRTIKGLKTKSDGEFYSYAKVLNETDLTTLENLAYKFLLESTKNILDGNFNITAKIIDNKENISCEYCKLKDICFHTNKENIYLKSDKTFLKKESDSHGLDS